MHFSPLHILCFALPLFGIRVIYILRGKIQAKKKNSRSRLRSTKNQQSMNKIIIAVDTCKRNKSNVKIMFWLSILNSSSYKSKKISMIYRNDNNTHILL